MVSIKPSELAGWPSRRLRIDSRDALALFLLQSSQAIKVYCSQAAAHQFMMQPHG